MYKSDLIYNIQSNIGTNSCVLDSSYQEQVSGIAYQQPAAGISYQERVLVIGNRYQVSYIIQVMLTQIIIYLRYI